MPDECVTFPICDERCKRLEEEDRRQNERLKQLENSIDEMNRLARSTEKIAFSIEKMLEEQKEHGARISKLEERDGEKWRGAVKTVITVILTAAVTAALAFLPK